jgi:hypothetical protein
MVTATAGPAISPGPWALALIGLTPLILAVTLLPKSAGELSGTAAFVARVRDGTVWVIDPCPEDPDLLGEAAAGEPDLAELDALGADDELAEDDIADELDPEVAVTSVPAGWEVQPASSASAATVRATADLLTTERRVAATASAAAQVCAWAEKAPNMIPPNQSPDTRRAFPLQG